MKKLFVFNALILFVLMSFAQNLKTEINPKLLTKYSSDQLEIMQSENPDDLDYLNFYADHSWIIMDFPTDKPIPHQLLYLKNDETGEYTQIMSVDEIGNDFNPYIYKCETYKDKPLFYRIGDTSKMIKMLSENEL
ncbi:MAG: hypothetical protein ABIJ97_05080 [Bacteroidota bacterium]